jgi:Thiamine pyrophosphate enzyme, N-terminal TPP binding domain
MNGAQALFKALVDAGLDICFGNPGTSEMQLIAEIGRTEGVRAILCLEENVVTGAADGYGRMAGKPAFTLLHVGSGFGNGIANLHNAGRANTAIVNVVGANATYHQHNYPEHEFINGKIDLARVVSHWAHEAKSASDLAVLGAMVARYSRIGAGKICTVVAPTDCHWNPAVAPPVPAAPMETPRVSPQTAWFKICQFWVTTGVRKPPAREPDLGVFCSGGGQPSPSQARRGCGSPRPSRVSQCGWRCPVINSHGLLPLRSARRLRMKRRWFRKNCSRPKYESPRWRRSVK